MGELHYQERQRDYTPLGTTLIYRSYNGPRMRAYLGGYQPSPAYILVRDGVLYHFFTLEDEIGRARAWAKRHTLQDLQAELPEFRQLLATHFELLNTAKDQPPLDALMKLYESYDRLLPLPVAAIWVPQHAADLISPEVLKILLDIRHEAEDIYKLGESLHDELLTRIEQERGLEPSTLRWLSIREFEQYLADGSHPDVAPRRTFLLVEDAVDGERVFATAEALKQFPFLETAVDPDLAEVKGQTASPGKVQGRVRILLKVDQLADFQPGEILLASMTDPRYLPAMKKAAAIVTNEGGITSHAAIVSRELGVPCVIATKIATKVFKSGDLVEVDATKGLVRRI